jgi:hypothetical protein
MRILKAKKQTATTKKNVDVANPIKHKATASDTNPVMIGPRVLNLATSQLEIGSPIMELMGMNNKMVPNSASLKLKLVLIVGILDAHVEKQNPDRKKNTLRNIRYFDFEIILF